MYSVYKAFWLEYECKICTQKFYDQTILSPKTMKLVFTASLLVIQHCGTRTKNGGYGVGIRCQSEMACLISICCFSEEALKKILSRAASIRRSSSRKNDMFSPWHFSIGIIKRQLFNHLLIICILGPLVLLLPKL